MNTNKEWATKIAVQSIANRLRRENPSLTAKEALDKALKMVMSGEAGKPTRSKRNKRGRCCKKKGGLTRWDTLKDWVYATKGKKITPVSGGKVSPR